MIPWGTEISLEGIFSHGHACCALEEQGNMAEALIVYQGCGFGARASWAVLLLH